jgi:hypothetical protein
MSLAMTLMIMMMRSIIIKITRLSSVCAGQGAAGFLSRFPRLSDDSPDRWGGGGGRGWCCPLKLRQRQGGGLHDIGAASCFGVQHGLIKYIDSKA